MKIDVLLIIFQIFLDGTQELEILGVAPRVAEGEPVLFDLAVELKTERHLDFVVLISPLTMVSRRSMVVTYPDKGIGSSVPRSVDSGSVDGPHAFLANFVLGQ